MNNIKHVINTPWKALNEISMYILYPVATLYLKIIKKVEIGNNYKFYGLPKIFRHRNSDIVIGDRFENRNSTFSNPLGVNHPTILCTWDNGAKIKIGNDVGITGGSLVASKSIEIGDGTIVGANCTIIDTDFHPIKSKKRRYDKNDISTSSVIIGKNVFIGMNSIILKGVNIPDHSVVPAGSVIHRKTKLT